jgi:hypothetical protein
MMIPPKDSYQREMRRLLISNAEPTLFQVVYFDFWRFIRKKFVTIQPDRCFAAIPPTKLRHSGIRNFETGRSQNWSF